MKKVFRMAAMAVLVMGLTTACKQKTEEAIDTTPVDTMIVEEVVDSAIEEVAEPVKEEVKATKKTAKKEVKEENVMKEGKKGATEGVAIRKADGSNKTIQVSATPESKEVSSTKADNKTNTFDPKTAKTRK